MWHAQAHTQVPVSGSIHQNAGFDDSATGLGIDDDSGELSFFVIRFGKEYVKIRMNACFQDQLIQFDFSS